jgi:hypothetical protein
MRTETAISEQCRPLPGSRFKMSVLGAARCPRLSRKEGIIVGGGRHNSSIRVLFDGSKSPISLHRDYIEQIPADAEYSCPSADGLSAGQDAQIRRIEGILPSRRD